MSAFVAAVSPIHVNAVLFYSFAAIAVSGALGVVLSRNPVHSALFLVMTMITMAVFFLTLDAPMVAIVQVVVYASAIVVLFLFVIMLLGIDRHESLATDARKYQRPAGAALGLLTFIGLVGVAVGNWELGPQTQSGRAISATRTNPVTGITEHDNIRPLARTLFTQFAWQFQVTAVLLVIAVVGAVVLARRSARPTSARSTSGAGAQS